MSDGRKTKTDLLVRVRYQNPLPPPPFPPRLLHIETTPERYGGYSFLQPLVNEREFPMIIDVEMGMPMELGKIRPDEFGDGEYWMGNRSRAAPKGPNPTPDDEDLFLLGDAANAPVTASASSAVLMGERKKVDVSWLRRTEYLSSDAANKVTGGTGGLGTIRVAKAPVVAPTRASRAEAITKTFDLPPLSTLRHPTKPHLRAEASWDVLPDVQLWANQLGLVKFGEAPGDSKGVRDDPRLPRALFRAATVPGEAAARIGYFLPKDDETALAYEKRRRLGPSLDDDDEDVKTEFEFHLVRDYEVASTRRLDKEYVFTFEEGPVEGEDAPMDGRLAKRPRGAYYAALNTSQTLRKRRPKRGEDPKVLPPNVEGLDYWDGCFVEVKGLELLGDHERQDRMGMDAEVTQWEDSDVNKV